MEVDLGFFTKKSTYYSELFYLFFVMIIFIMFFLNGIGKA